jgi:hypothetical protein
MIDPPPLAASSASLLHYNRGLFQINLNKVVLERGRIISSICQLYFSITLSLAFLLQKVAEKNCNTRGRMMKKTLNDTIVIKIINKK